MKKFNKRYYHTPGEFFKDLTAIMQHRKEIRSMMKGDLLSDAFREQIMMAVTEVNGCRYCNYAHAKMALKAGISEEEIAHLADGVFEHCPPEEVPALFYAQHWAETNACPDEDARQKVLEVYGPEKTQAIELAMRMIRIGNLMGNTGDYILFRISFGRWGNDQASKQD